MNGTRNMQFFSRRRALAGLLALAASGAAGAAAPPSGHDAAGAQACDCLYSVINLAPEGSMGPYLNEKGQAAFGSYLFGTDGFFDGDRIYPIGLRGAGGTQIGGLNDRGVVFGTSLFQNGPYTDLFAFKWTLGGGMRKLPDSLYAQPADINDKDQIVGWVLGPTPEIGAHAVRWDPNGRVVNLGPLPVYLSQADAINNHTLAGGTADFSDGKFHATLWDPAGRMTDLGSMGHDEAAVNFINDSDEAAGSTYDFSTRLARPFFWSRRTGTLPIPAQSTFGDTIVTDMNKRGEVVGMTDVSGTERPYLWSRSRGLALLPVGTGVEAAVADINNRTQMVGRIADAPGQPHAVRWDGLSKPVDLNRLLYRPPAGLLLVSAVAINDDGTILAHSNAGLVMLRPGKRGTDAPVLGPIDGVPGVISVGQELRFTFGFVDNSPTQTHTATVQWDDNCASPPPLVIESGGVGQVRFQHLFCAPGSHLVRIRVADSGGRVTDAGREFIVSEPGAGTISGEGTLAGGLAAGAPTLHFGLFAPIGAGTGQPFLALDGSIHFRTDQVGAAAASGQLVRLEGSGRLDGRPGYRFLVEAIDGDRAQPAGADRMRVRITHTDTSGADVVDYDNGMPASTSGGAPARAVASSAAGGAPDRPVLVNGSITLSN